MRDVVQQLVAKEAVLPGGARVLRALPLRERRRVGPFVFLDHGGPSPVVEAHRVVGDHPHVGLSTLSYLFSGEVMHRDSISSEQRIGPGDVNLMTSGRGIMHAEKVLGDGPFHMLQLWVALPHAERTRAPSFDHVPAAAIPVFKRGGATVRVVAGALETGEFAANPLRSPVPAFHPILALDVDLAPGASVDVPVPTEFELAAYVVSGSAEVGATTTAAHALSVTGPGESLRLASGAGARVFVVGGAHMPDPTVTWWNFVVDDVATGRALEETWKAGRFEPVDWRSGW